MSVPSYDDLTPGIPDEVDAESVGSLLSLLGPQLPASSSRLPASSSRLPASGSGFQLPASSSLCRFRLQAESSDLQAEDPVIFATRFRAEKKLSQTPRWLASVARPDRVSL